MFNTAKERDLLIELGRKCIFIKKKRLTKDISKPATLYEFMKSLGYSGANGFVNGFLKKLISVGVLEIYEFGEFSKKSKFDKYVLDENKLLDLLCSQEWFKEYYDYLAKYIDLWSNGFRPSKNIHNKVYKDWKHRLD